MPSKLPGPRSRTGGGLRTLTSAGPVFFWARPEEQKGETSDCQPGRLDGARGPRPLSSPSLSHAPVISLRSDRTRRQAWQEDWMLGTPPPAGSSREGPPPNPDPPFTRGHQAPGGSGRSDSEPTKCHPPLLAGAGPNQGTVGSRKSGDPKGRGQGGVVGECRALGGLRSAGRGQGPRLELPWPSRGSWCLKASRGRAAVTTAWGQARSQATPSSPGPRGRPQAPTGRTGKRLLLRGICCVRVVGRRPPPPPPPSASVEGMESRPLRGRAWVPGGPVSSQGPHKRRREGHGETEEAACRP